MVKTNTQFRAIKSLISNGLTFLFLLLLTFGAQAQTYTRPTHYYGCGYQNFGRTYTSYAAIDAVTIEDADGNVVYSKNGDACNSSPQGYRTTGHHNVVEPNSAFNLNAGSTYKVTIGALNPNNQTFYDKKLNFALCMPIDY